MALRSHTSGSRGAQRKKEVRRLIDAHDCEGIRTWARQSRNPLRTLTGMLFQTDPLVCRRSVEALGIAAGVVAEHSLEKVRNLIRKLLWMMNDESGNLCWCAPEAIAEVLVNVPSLMDEYAPLLIGYLQEEPFERGAHWAIARVAAVRPDIFEDDVATLARSLDDDDAVIRGYTLLALTSLGASSVLPQVQTLTSDAAPVHVYDYQTGTLTEVSVAQLAERFLAAISQQK